MTSTRVAQAATRRFCAALAGFALHLETHAKPSVLTFGQSIAASSNEIKIPGKLPPRFGIIPCA